MQQRSITIECTFLNGHKSKELSLYRITEDHPILIKKKRTVQAYCKIEMPFDDEAYYYVVAKDLSVQKRNLLYVAAFDSQADFVSISERSTVAIIYCFAQFIDIDQKGKLSISGAKDTLSICYGMKNNFLYADGNVSRVISSAPNGLVTNSYAMFNFLGSLLFYAAKNQAIYKAFTSICSGGGQASSTVDALFYLAQNPFDNAREVYKILQNKKPVFEPCLTTLDLPKGHSPIPNQWTLTIKVNESGSKNFLISGPGYIAFDKENRIWIVNNTRQGTPNSGTFCVILNSDGSPADFSPLFGGGLLGGGFGVCVNNEGDKVYIGNYGWGPIQCNPQEGSISVFTNDGQVLSPSNGFTKGTSRVQGMKCDSKGNLWICSWGTQNPLAPSPDTVFHFKEKNSAVVCYLDGDPDKAVIYEFDNPYYCTFDLIIDNEDNVFVSNSGHKKIPRLKKEVRSSVYKLKLEGEKIIKLASWESKKEHTSAITGDKTVGIESFRQVALNRKGEVFVGAIVTNRILKFSNDLEYLGDFTNNIDAPWGVTIDGSGTIYSANFRRDSSLLSKKKKVKNRSFGVTLIKNENDKKVYFMDVPTGGEEVTLANGFPLYGNQPPSKKKSKERVGPCYEPLMRMTSTRIDRAGNLWAVNNWKPFVYADLNENPGGDGLIAFVGVAPPPE